MKATTMALIKSKPTSPGRRFAVRSSSEMLHKGNPHGPLVSAKSKSGGRNNKGRITTRHRGGGHKQRYREVDFKRAKDGVPGRVERIEYDPNRSAHLALVLYVDGERKLRFYNTALHLKDLTPGDHEIAVEISANNHAAYAVDGVPIRATETITVPEAEVTHHGHDPQEVDPASAPTVGLAVMEDPKSGWNLQIDLENFTITPENASSDPVDGEGHLHLYVDGERVTRLYGTWWHLAELTKGNHEVAVEVSANNHAALAVDGAPIRATANIDVSADRAAAAGGADDEHDDHDDAMEDESDSIVIHKLCRYSIVSYL